MVISMGTIVKAVFIVAILIGVFMSGYYAAIIDGAGADEECVGDLIIGEEDSEDWPYLSLSLDADVKTFEKKRCITLRVKKLDMTRK